MRLHMDPVRVSSVVMRRNLPPGARTRASSLRPGRGSGRCSRTQPQTRASNSRIGIRQPGEIGRREADARIRNAAAGALEHSLGKVEAGDEGVGVGLFEDELRITAVAAAGVENAFAAAEVERFRLEDLAGKSFVAGENAGDAGELAGDAVVVALDKPLVFGDRLLAQLTRLDGAGQSVFAAGVFGDRESFLRFHGGQPSSIRGTNTVRLFRGWRATAS